MKFQLAIALLALFGAASCRSFLHHGNPANFDLHLEGNPLKNLETMKKLQDLHASFAGGAHELINALRSDLISLESRIDDLEVSDEAKSNLHILARQSPKLIDSIRKYINEIKKIDSNNLNADSIKNLVVNFVHEVKPIADEIRDSVQELKRSRVDMYQVLPEAHNVVENYRQHISKQVRDLANDKDSLINIAKFMALHLAHSRGINLGGASGLGSAAGLGAGLSGLSHLGAGFGLGNAAGLGAGFGGNLAEGIENAVEGGLNLGGAIANRVTGDVGGLLNGIGHALGGAGLAAGAGGASGLRAGLGGFRFGFGI